MFWTSNFADFRVAEYLAKYDEVPNGLLSLKQP